MQLGLIKYATTRKKADKDEKIMIRVIFTLSLQLIKKLIDKNIGNKQ